MSDIVLKGGFSENEDGESKVVIRDGDGRILFVIAKDADGKVSLKDPEGNALTLQPGTLPTTPADTGTEWALTYNPTTEEYSWKLVNVPVE